MKQTLAYTILFALLSSIFGTAGIAKADGEPYKRNILVSAYYSPLPNQARYLRGDYESDLRLNGNGTNGADGTPVYVGMLAAPKTYVFGTRLELPGLGVGTVHDRGGAIVEKEDYDRIDVWMGYGDEGLTRALNWGMRLVEGTVHPSAEIAEKLDYSWISGVSPVRKSDQVAATKAATFTSVLANGDSGNQVTKLQNALTSLGFYADDVNGSFDDTTEAAVIRFQIANNVIASENEQGAGVFGLKTRSALLTAINTTSTVAKQAPSTDNTKLAIAAGLSKDATGADVRMLQSVLFNLGIYNGPITGVYDAETIAAVLAFQQSQGVIQDETENGAGVFGAKTKQALGQVMQKYQAKAAAFPKTKTGVMIGKSEEKNSLSAVYPPLTAFPSAKSTTMTPIVAKGNQKQAVASFPLHGALKTKNMIMESGVSKK